MHTRRQSIQWAPRYMHRDTRRTCIIHYVSIYNDVRRLRIVSTVKNTPGPLANKAHGSLRWRHDYVCALQFRLALGLAIPCMYEYMHPEAVMLHCVSCLGRGLPVAGGGPIAAARALMVRLECVLVCRSARALVCDWQCAVRLGLLVVEAVSCSDLMDEKTPPGGLVAVLPKCREVRALPSLKWSGPDDIEVPTCALPDQPRPPLHTTPEQN